MPLPLIPILLGFGAVGAVGVGISHAVSEKITKEIAKGFARAKSSDAGVDEVVINLG